MEKVSVIMPVYKETKEQIEASVKSILNQTYKKIQFIIIVDNPDENWRIDYLKSFNDERIQIIVNEKNLGITDSLNRGLEIATGKYIARMDSDDIAIETRLEKQLKYLKENKLDIIGSDVIFFINNKDIKYVRYPHKNRTIKKLIYYQNCIAHPTYFFKKDILEKNKKYNDIYASEDYDFLLRAIKNGYRAGNVPEPLLRYRINFEGISRKNPGKQICTANFIKKYYKRKKNQYTLGEALKKYVESSKYNKDVEQYNKYMNLKNARLEMKKSNANMYIIDSFKMIFYFKQFSKDIYEIAKRKIYYFLEDNVYRNK